MGQRIMSKANLPVSFRKKGVETEMEQIKTQLADAAVDSERKETLRARFAELVDTLRNIN
jgi:hypothetical protein